MLSGQFLIDSEASLKGVEARLSADGKQGATSTSATPQIYRTTARVEAVAGAVVTLTHPAIPELKWPGMTMDFQLAPDISHKLAVGNEIDIAFHMRESDAPLIVQWKIRNDKKGNGKKLGGKP